MAEWLHASQIIGLTWNQGGHAHFWHFSSARLLATVHSCTQRDSLFPSYLIQVRFLGLSEFSMSKCNLPVDCIVKTHINIYKYIIK